MVVIGNINTGSRCYGSFFIRGNHYVTGNIVVAGNLLADYWEVTRGLTVRGNLDIAGNFSIGANVIFSSTEDAYSTQSGALHIAGGLSIRKNIAIGGNILAYGDLSFVSTTDSTSKTTGALILAGGLGIAKNLNVGETLKIDKSLIVPLGTTAERPTDPRQGDFRYNTDYNEIEFYDKNSNWRTIINPQDLDKNTKIVISDTIDDNIIRFYTEGNQRIMMANNANSGFIAIGRGFNAPKSTLDIQGNLMVSGNAYFNKGVIIGNSNNSTELIPGTIRFTGLDLEGYLNNNWVSLTTASNNLSFDSGQPFTTYQFHISQVSQTHRIGNRILGNPNEESNMFGHLYYHKYQKFNKNITIQKIEIAIDDESANNANLSFDIRFYVNDVLKETITITNTQGDLVPTITSLTELIVYENERVSFTAKANDTASEDAELLISLHGTYTATEINLSGNLNLLFNNNITFTQNLTVNDNLNVLSNLNILGGALKLGFVNEKIDGRVRYSGSDIEGCINDTWVSLTRSQNSASFSAISPYRTEQFQFSKIETSYKYGSRGLGTNNVFYSGSYYEFKYQKLRGAVQFRSVEVILDERSIDAINALEYTLIIEVNDVISKTITIPFASGEYSAIVSFGTVMPTSNNDLISVKLKGNNSYSVDLDLIICLLGDATLSNITLDANTNIDFNSNVTINSNLTVTGNAIFRNGLLLGNNSLNIAGSLKYNSTTGKFEGYTNGNWSAIGGSTLDIDEDTKILVEENSDDDTIRFYTQNNQRMMIGNTINSGYIGIGLGFNSPKSTLDIVGNLMVSGNSFFNSGIILGSNTQDVDGTIRFQSNDFEGYVLGNWTSLVSDTSANIITSFPYTTGVFEFRKTTQSYKYANRSSGVDSADINDLGSAFIYKYQRIKSATTFDTIEIIQDDQSIILNDFTFTFKIEVNDVVQHTETFTFTQNETEPKLITMSSTLSVVANDVISIKLKGDDANSVDADLIAFLIGTTPLQTFSLNGDANFLLNNSVTASKTFSVTENFNALSNVNISGNLNVAGNCIFNNDLGIGISPLYQLHLSTDSAAKPSTNTWTISSDKRIKTNIQSLTKDELYNISKNFNVRKYKFKETYRKAHKLKDKFYLGIIADEVNEYMPCCVDTYNLKYKIGSNNNQDIYEEITDCLNYNGSELQFALFGCIPHIIEENINLKNRLDILEKKIN